VECAELLLHLGADVGEVVEQRGNYADNCGSTRLVYFLYTSFRLVQLVKQLRIKRPFTLTLTAFLNAQTDQGAFRAA
jgi:hypothetical protein